MRGEGCDARMQGEVFGGMGRTGAACCVRGWANGCGRAECKRLERARSTFRECARSPGWALAIGRGCGYAFERAWALCAGVGTVSAVRVRGLAQSDLEYVHRWWWCHI